MAITKKTDLLQNPQNLITLIRDLTARVKALELKTTQGNTSEAFAPALGNIDYRVTDDSGVVRAAMSGQDLFAEFGIHAYLAGFDGNGVPQWWLDSNTGSIAAGGGDVLLDVDGLTLPIEHTDLFQQGVGSIKWKYGANIGMTLEAVYSTNFNQVAGNLEVDGNASQKQAVLNLTAYSYAGGSPSFINIMADNISVNEGAPISIIDYGSWTPIPTNVSNLASSIAEPCYWIRVGPYVFCWGTVSVTARVSGISTEVDLSLPVASNFTSVFDMGGAGQQAGDAGGASRLYADATNKRIRMTFFSTSTSERIYSFSFGYIIR
jgi:hypothetical protein